jgi:hypothetical protein
MAKRNFAMALAAALVLSAPASAVQVHTNAKYGYKTIFPDGWTVATDKADPGSVFAISNDVTTGANCGVTAIEEASTVNATQEQLNSQMRAPLGREFWRTTVFGSGEQVAFESDGVRIHPSGLIAQQAIASSAPKEAGGQRVKVIALLMLSPGLSFAMVCAAQDAGFETVRPTLKQVIDSFRTKNNPGGSAVDANPVAPPPVIPAASGQALPAAMANALQGLAAATAARTKK